MRMIEKGILREFELVVYPVRLVVVIGDMENEVNALYLPLDEGYDVIKKPDEQQVGGVVYDVRNKKTGKYCLLVWFPTTEDCTGSNICHEVGHTSLEIFRYIGARIEYNNQEPFCYLLGTIFRLINGALHELTDSSDRKSRKK